MPDEEEGDWSTEVTPSGPENKPVASCIAMVAGWTEGRLAAAYRDTAADAMASLAKAVPCNSKAQH